MQLPKNLEEIHTALEQNRWQSIHITIPAQLKELASARRFYLEVAIKAKIPKSVTAQIEMGLDELLANIIEHSFHQNPDKTLSVHAYYQRSMLILKVSGQGIPYEGVKNYSIDLESHFSEFQTRGLGTFVIKTFFDKVFYEIIPDNAFAVWLIKFIQ